MATMVVRRALAPATTAADSTYETIKRSDHQIDGPPEATPDKADGRRRASGPINVEDSGER